MPLRTESIADMKDNFRKEFVCEIVSKEMLNFDTAYITLACDEIAQNAIPGQFVNVSCSYFLKRPFGIASVDKSNGTFSIGVKVVGKGTSEIVAFEKGAKVNVLGPLGNGFDFSGFENVILVAGGTGVFPINFADEYLTSRGINHTVVQGFRNSSQVVMNKSNYCLTTDAGDAGIMGNACDGLSSLDKSLLTNAGLFVVGPLPMMKACGQWASANGLKCFVSMEQRMACGIGICLVCVCKLKAQAQGIEFKHVRCCKDGPVFPFEEVIW